MQLNFEVNLFSRVNQSTHKNFAGVYIITNRVTGKSYIGRSHDVKHRASNHRYMLRNGTHSNPSLQAEYDLYGDDNFYISYSVETDDLGQLDTLELMEMQKFTRDMLLNKQLRGAVLN